MRIKLKEIGYNTRERYTAVVGRCGIKYNSYKKFPERTFVLNDVTLANKGEIVTDHLWVTVGKTLAKLDLKSGDKISFNARVGMYKKGYHFKINDCKLNRMTKIEVERIDRKINKEEITSGKAATFQEWREMQEMKVLEKEIHIDDNNPMYDYEIQYVKRLEELKALFDKRYYDAMSVKA